MVFGCQTKARWISEHFTFLNVQDKKKFFKNTKENGTKTPQFPQIGD